MPTVSPFDDRGAQPGELIGRKEPFALDLRVLADAPAGVGRVARSPLCAATFKTCDSSASARFAMAGVAFIAVCSLATSVRSISATLRSCQAWEDMEPEDPVFGGSRGRFLVAVRNVGQILDRKLAKGRCPLHFLAELRGSVRPSTPRQSSRFASTRALSTVQGEPCRPIVNSRCFPPERYFRMNTASRRWRRTPKPRTSLVPCRRLCWELVDGTLRDPTAIGHLSLPLARYLLDTTK